MFASTTVRNTPAKPKDFAWSYSRLKNFESCPKRHYHIDVAKDVSEEEGEALQYGNFVHKALADRIAKGTPIPDPHKVNLEPWAQRVLKGHPDAKAYEAATGAKVLVEQKLAITKEFDACDFYDKVKQPWFRGIGDVIIVNGPVALTLDWKTGKIIEDSVQLALTAACIFAAYPSVQRIRSSFVWLKEDAQTNADLSRTDMPALWAGVLPRVKLVQHAYDNNEFPAKPGFLCRRWCPVSKCPHHGE
jgi:hypothetical protein